MADSRHFENRKYDLHQVLHDDEDIGANFKFLQKNCENIKIQDGGRPPF